jgi:serine/threonine protein kinase
METTSKLSGQPDYLLTRAVEAMADLQILARAQNPDHPRHEKLVLSREERRRLAGAMADLFRLLARTRVRHRDMKPSNILVTREDDGFELWLVDLDRTRFEVDWTRKLWVYHLAQCNAGLADGISLLDRMRCLRRVGRGRWSADERLAIARDVLALSLTRKPEWRRGKEGERNGE